MSEHPDRHELLNYLRGTREWLRAESRRNGINLWAVLVALFVVLQESFEPLNLLRFDYEFRKQTFLLCASVMAFFVFSKPLFELTRNTLNSRKVEKFYVTEGVNGKTVLRFLVETFFKYLPPLILIYMYKDSLYGLKTSPSEDFIYYFLILFFLSEVFQIAVLGFASTKSNLPIINVDGGVPRSEFLNRFRSISNCISALGFTAAILLGAEILFSIEEGYFQGAVLIAIFFGVIYGYLGYSLGQVAYGEAEETILYVEQRAVMESMSVGQVKTLLQQLSKSCPLDDWLDKELSELKAEFEQYKVAKHGCASHADGENNDAMVFALKNHRENIRSSLDRLGYWIRAHLFIYSSSEYLIHNLLAFAEKITYLVSEDEDMKSEFETAMNFGEERNHSWKTFG